jgi:hypothetical protein
MSANAGELITSVVVVNLLKKTSTTHWLSKHQTRVLIRDKVDDYM